MSIKILLLPIICMLMLIPFSNSFWRLPCAKPITLARLDPIINYGLISPHIHTIMGASGFNSRSDPTTIRKSVCSTCSVKEDNSNYWIASLFYQHVNGTLESVTQTGGMLVYYLQRPGFDGEKIFAPPKNLRMVAGSPMKRTGDNTLESQALSYNCINFAGGSPETQAFPQKACPQGLRTQVFFPSCWDGVNTDSANHKSHMAYPDGMNTGICPSTHPVKIISIFYEVLWQVDKFQALWLDTNGKPLRAQPFVWSFGDNTGFGMHGDFLNGWDTNVLQNAVDGCTDMSGVIEKCQFFNLRSDDEMNSCLSEYLPEINEQVSGLMEQLPNISKMTVPVFNPCGFSPNQGYDNTIAGISLGTCTTSFQNKRAYIPTNGLMLTAGSPAGILKLAPNPIDQTGYLGCWMDGDNANRTMELNLGSGFTPSTCRKAVAAIKNTKYLIFGLQYGGECWATVSSTSYKALGVSNLCTLLCNADSNQRSFCGGPRTNQCYLVKVS